MHGADLISAAESREMKVWHSSFCCPNCASKALRIVNILAALLCVSVPDAFSAQGEYLGVRFDTSLTDLLAKFKERDIPVKKLDDRTVSSAKPLVLLDRVSEARFYFISERLYKMVVFFEVPPHEPTATRLLADYGAEQERLTELFGSATEKTMSMDAPSDQDRYKWLQQARGYCRSVWVTGEKVVITLWLYGSDEGIIFSEVYEKSQEQ